ncbi:hypothetical protein [Paenibacillus glacialis]|uniref:Uncharacterized protein n=1 Tax=Paenibacillus glacialis TaxID=494026 RepID=A0A162LTG2_9BACL|nr:hypothetical protein [Paenibacillus glacialis]OAB34023.1 hypothetical protein PGLA_24285 [Paenibacillus glacialis]
MNLIKILVLSVLIMTIGCSSTSKQDVFDYLSSDSSDRYRIHLFYEETTQLDNKLLVYWNSKQELLELIQGIQLFDVEVKKNKEMANAMELDDFPCFIILNDKEVVLKTKDLVDIEHFFKN